MVLLRFLFYRYLSTGNSFRNLATTLRMGAATVSKIVHESCTVLWEELVEEFMPVPTEAQLKRIAQEFFERWKFPNCVGCIDGKHCQIKCPVNSGSRYFNYLKYFSIVLQGVADADKKFITIEAGARGKQSDGGTFSSSALFRLLEENSFNMPSDNELPGTNIKLPHVLIGDEAYPLKPYLMRPFPSRNLTPIKENFNKRLSTPRKCIECAFGILKAKWGIFSTDIEVNVKRAISIIKCACILHNVIRERDGNSDLNYCQEVSRNFQSGYPTFSQPQQRPERGGVRRGSTLAKEIRDKFANYLFHF